MKTTIEWTDDTWNPTTGCDRVSPGCDNCYALTMAARLKAMGQEKYQADGDPRTSGPGFKLTVHPDTLDAPLHWRKPRRVFVNSMSDLFHPDVPDEFICQVFGTMGKAAIHTFQVLTKRPQRMAKLVRSLQWDIPSETVTVAADPARCPHFAGRARCLDCEERYETAQLKPCPSGDTWSPPPGASTETYSPPPGGIDEEALLANVELVGRTGAQHFEIGHDDDGMWWAKAVYRGTEVAMHNHGPVEATEALARRLLEGGRCTNCNRTIRLDGTANKSNCRWVRQGRTWIRSCAGPTG